MFIRKKEIKQLSARIEQEFGTANFFNKKDEVEIKDNIYYKNKQPVFFEQEGRLFPTLKCILNGEIKLKQIIVDMPAVPFVAKGADIMRPGIVELDPEIEKDEIIVIMDENNRKPLAIGISLFSGQELQQMDKGKVIKMIHYVGDEIWKK
ncbi:RNA-binding protein [Candidatus Woesearchaeota archaeon]|nr:RNA-binding protein [Candidatus Woesearchaeota archaeon]